MDEPIKLKETVNDTLMKVWLNENHNKTKTTAILTKMTNITRGLEPIGKEQILKMPNAKSNT